MRERYGWEMYYYGNLPWPGSTAERGWYTFDHRPRFGTNYAGLRGRLAILSEAYAYATFEERILATLYFVEEVLNYAHAHASTIQALTAAADTTSIVGTTQAIRAQHARSEAPVEILLGDVVPEQNPYSGATVLRRTETRTPEQLYEYGTFAATESVVAPQAYYVPAELTIVLDRLQVHGVQMTPLDASRALAAERFLIDSTTVARRTFQGRQARTLYGRYVADTLDVPAGMVRVPVNQPLGRLVVALLEPRSDDGLTTWALLDEALDGAATYPIVREPVPVAGANSQ